MSEMLTRVANALAQRFKDRVATMASTPEKPVTFEETGVICPPMDIWMDYARAGVEAMHEPTAAMIAVGRRGPDDQYSYDHDCLIVWRDMIDGALK